MHLDQYSYLLLEAMLVKGVIKINEAQQRPDGREHALADVITTVVSIQAM